MQYLLFVILAPIAGLGIMVTLVYAWHRRNVSGAKPLMVYLLVVLGLLLSLTIELVDPTEQGTLFWAKFGYLFIAALPVAWLGFALEYAGKHYWFGIERFWIFCIIPAITFFLAQGTEQHGLIWTGYRFVDAGMMLSIQVDHGPWFYVFGVYMYSLLLVGALIIGRAFFGSHRIYRQQSLWVVIGAVFPLPFNVIYVFDWVPGLLQDFTPLAFAFSGMFFTLGIFKYRLLSLTPVARNVMIDTMPDGVLVLDLSLRVVDLNPAARQILDLENVDDVFGLGLPVLWPESDLWSKDPGSWPEVVRIDRPGFRRAYGLRATELGNRNSPGQRGWLVVLVDVSRLANAEEALALANQSLGDANLALRRLNEELEARIAARTVSLSQRAQELEALARVSSVLRKASGLEELQNILLEETIAVLEASAGAIFLLEDEELLLSAVQALPGLPGARLAACPDPLWRVVESGVALHLSRAALAEEPASDLFISLIGNSHELSIAPVHASNRILGLLLLVFDRPLATMLEEYARLLTAIAEMAGNALQRVRTVENLEMLVQDRTRDLSALYEVTTVSNQVLELPDLLYRILTTVLRVLNSRATVLHLVEENRSPFPAGAAAWKAGAPVNILAESAENDRHDPGAVFAAFPLFLAAHAGLEPGMLALLPSPHDPSSPWVKVLLQQGIVVQPTLPVPIQTGAEVLSASVSVPVRAKGNILGVLSVLVESIGRFSAEDIALLAAISDHVGSAVERSRLVQRAEEAAVIEERQRLARDLHDSVTQSLYSLVLFAEAGKDALKVGYTEKAGSHLERLRETSQQALKEMRLLIYELRPMALQTDGLVGALRHRLEAVEHRSGIDARLMVENLAPLPERIEVGLYGIAQEALNNVLKHAHATRLDMRLNVSETCVRMEITDNGRGFDGDNGHPDSGVGLASMRERARVIGGELAIHSQAGQGTSILVEVNREVSR